MDDMQKYFDMINSIKNGDTQKVIDIIEEFGLSFCPMLDRGYPLLTAAVGKNQVELVAYLLQNNAKVNSDRDVLSPLQIAAMNNNTTIFKMLLERGAKISDYNIHNNKSPIKLAVERNNFDITRLILKHKNFGKKYDQSLLHTAVQNNSLEMVSLLLEIGVDVNEYDDDRSAPIHHAVMASNNDILQLLLDYGSDINAKNQHGNTPVFLAVNNGYISTHRPIFPRRGLYYTDPKKYNTLNTLVDNDADINVLNIDKYLPVHVAVIGSPIDNIFNYGDADIIKCIIKQIVKLKSLNVPLSRNNDNVLSSLVAYQQFDDFKKMCELEMSRTITEKIPDSEISLHDIMIKNYNFLAECSKNRSHEMFIFSSAISERFPVYGSAIRLRFTKGLARKNLLEKSTTIFHDLFPVASKLLSNGVDDVFKCLDNNDLRHFLRMFQQDN
ncbi:serine/threonine-protein phosphatase 6 regulatory ankyrin repeat subunit C-like [Microplitis mediator]|uniref:serine/threonine-protein phosphatase 6 regulatory ankyrin repeat subunit C-like n=1 Tax=Microplitis mediator TaxID=375433 RepID=UPI0025526D12|nr:serine/threonine-protein phosphatase 6 regulatory ankyrin repeat subunit C-like [Microplitis mediator]